MSTDSLLPFCCLCIGGQADSLWNLLGQALEWEKMYGTADWAANLTGAQLQGWERSHICCPIPAFLQHDLTNTISENCRIFFSVLRLGWADLVPQVSILHMPVAALWAFYFLLHSARKSFAVNWRANYWWLSSAVKLLMHRSRTGLGWTWVWKVFLYHAGQIYVWILFLFMYFSWPLQLRLHCD